MLKKFFIFCAAVGVILYFLYNFILDGTCEEFILEHSQSSWAPGSLYYLGNLFIVFQANDRAEEIYEVVIDTFSDTSYYESAYYKYFRLAATNSKRKKKAIERGRKFLNEFPDSPRADVVKKRLNFLKEY